MSGLSLSGDVGEGFGPVADVFAANFETHGEVGAAVSVVHDGRTVVDLWAGFTDRARTKPWRRDTIATTFSTTKGVTATCACLLIDRGQLDPDAPIARYWPEFGANGKAAVSVRSALAHTAGLAAIDASVTLDDIVGWDGVVGAIAAQEPNWEPGTAHGYHARTYGWIVGELIRRVSGRMPGRYFREEIADPHELDFWIGLPPEQDSRVADLVPDPNMIDLGALVDHESLLYRVMAGPSGVFDHGYDETWNEERLRRVEMPSSSGIGDAVSLARLYAMLIGAGPEPPLLTAEMVERATEVQSDGIDCVIGRELTFGLGYSLPPTLPAPIGPRSFGHAGAGGSLAFADPGAGLGFGYVMNQLRFDLEGDPRSEGLVAALYECLG